MQTDTDTDSNNDTDSDLVDSRLITVTKKNFAETLQLRASCFIIFYHNLFERQNRQAEVCSPTLQKTTNQKSHAVRCALYIKRFLDDGGGRLR